MKSRPHLKYDIVFLIGGGIGNVIEALYAVEYCLRIKTLNVGLHVSGVPDSFREDMKMCYPRILIDRLEGIGTKRLVQAFTVPSMTGIEFEEYYYVMADARSSRNQSETELYLSVVRGLYPSGLSKNTLTHLVSSRTHSNEHLENRIALSPGCSPERSAKRWPHYEELVDMLGEDRTVIIGSGRDLDNSYSYIYPFFVPEIFPQTLLNRKRFWNALRKARLLIPYGHHGLASRTSSYFGVLSWSEIAHVMKTCRLFIGNDGGLMHFAAALGAKGIALFGPTSKQKNRPMNITMIPYSRALFCQPCQFVAGGIPMGDTYITCPFSVKCLADISAGEVLEFIRSRFEMETSVQ